MIVKYHNNTNNIQVKLISTRNQIEINYTKIKKKRLV